MMLVPAIFLVNLAGTFFQYVGKKHKATLMFKTINELTPPFLHDLFKSRNSGYNLRNSEHTLYVPKPRTNYGKRSFSYSGANVVE